MSVWEFLDRNPLCMFFALIFACQLVNSIAVAIMARRPCPKCKALKQIKREERS